MKVSSLSKIPSSKVVLIGLNLGYNPWAIPLNWMKKSLTPLLFLFSYLIFECFMTNAITIVQPACTGGHTYPDQCQGSDWPSCPRMTEEFQQACYYPIHWKRENITHSFQSTTHRHRANSYSGPIFPLWLPRRDPQVLCISKLMTDAHEKGHQLFVCLAHPTFSLKFFWLKMAGH